MAMIPQIQIMLQQAIQAFQGGNFDSADIILNRVLRVDSKNLIALHILGLVKAQQSKYLEAANLLRRAARINPEDASIQYNLAKALSDSGNDDDALAHHKKAISLAPNNPEVWFSYGKTASNLGRHEEALSCYNRSLNLKPDYLEALLNMSTTLKELKRYEDAIGCYEKALSIKPGDYEIWKNCGVVLFELRRYKDALVYFEKARGLNPDYFEGWKNSGAALHGLKLYNDAIAQYDQALRLNPGDCQSWLNKGATLFELKHYNEAIAQYDQALSLQPNYFDAFLNKGMALGKTKMFDQALASYENALQLNEEYAGLAGYVLGAKLQLSNWDNWAPNLQKIEYGIKKNKKLVDPFTALLLFDDLEIQKKSAELFAKDKFIKSKELGFFSKKVSNKKLRLGYFSSDLYFHPVSIWLAEQLEQHDKSKFELFAFSFTQVKDPMRIRLENIFDHFIEVDKNSDLEVAEISRSLGIDIAFDLCGHSGDARPEIFALGAAPIQVSHIGFPGTSGSDCIDYLLADLASLPESVRHNYSEKIAYVPCAYTYDSERELSKQIPTRAQFGLPENAIVFTCQNGNQKITPEVFDIWMDVLSEVPHSVLWLLQSNSIATDNLIKYAYSRGIQGDRLIFTSREIVTADQERARVSRYLASYQLADLFLDTWPYNAGTTAIDALFSGLPVLTKSGSSIVSRMATSALTAIDMPELITTTASEYKSLAIELGKNPDKLRLTKDKLKINKSKSLLFDASTNTKYLEAAYIRMYERHQSGLPPDHIFIS